MCNSLANYKFCSILLLATLLPDADLSESEADYQKKLYITEASPLWYPSYLGFLPILNALSLKTLSENQDLLNWFL